MAKMLLQTDNIARSKEQVRYQVEQRLRDYVDIPRTTHIIRVRAKLQDNRGLYFEPKWNPSHPISELVNEVMEALKENDKNNIWQVGKIKKKEREIDIVILSNKSEKKTISVEF